MTDNILITGGAGFIGSHLADALISMGHRVRILDNLEPQVHGKNKQWPSYLNPQVECIFGDVRKRSDVAKSLEGIDGIFHFATLTGVGQSMYQMARYTDVNVQGTATLLETLIHTDHRVKRIVLASSRAVYGEGAYVCVSCGNVHPPVRSTVQLDEKQWEVDCPKCGNPILSVPTPEALPPDPGSMYAITKLTQEQMLGCFGQTYGLSTVSLRFFNVYGPRQSLANPYTGILTTFIQALLHNKPPEVYEDGAMTRDFVYVSDVIQACLLAYGNKRIIGRYNVGSGQAVTILQLAQLMAKEISPNLQPRIVNMARVGDIRHCTADLQKAQSILGYVPKVSLEDGVKNILQQVIATKELDKSLQARDELLKAGILRV